MLTNIKLLFIVKNHFNLLAEREKYTKLITPVDTRWNSVYAMIKSILSMKQALTYIRENPIPDDPIATEIPTDEDMEFMEELCPILSDIDELRYTFICNFVRMFFKSI